MLNDLFQAALDLLPKPKPRHVGEGQQRASVREHQHRERQAARVASALPALAEKRAELARKRVARWQKKRRLDEAPGHIKAMSREQRGKVA